MPDLSEHLADSYELPEEWQQWLDADEGEGVETIDDADGRTYEVDRLKPETPWRIENDHVATWALRKLAAAEAELARVGELADTEVERIRVWQERESQRPIRDAGFFRGHLVAYWRRQVEALMAPLLEQGKTPEEAWEHIKKKSLSLPTGKVTARKAPAGVEVVDEEGFTRWAEENGYTNLVRSTPKPALDALKKLPVQGDVVCVPVALDTDDADAEPALCPVPGVKVKPTEFRYDAKPEAPAVGGERVDPDYHRTR